MGNVFHGKSAEVSAAPYSAPVPGHDVHKATLFWHPDTPPRPHFVFHIVTIELSMSTYRYSDPNKRCQDVFPECELEAYTSYLLHIYLIFISYLPHIYLIFTSYFQVFPPFLSVLWLLHCYTAPNDRRSTPPRCRCHILPSLGRRGGVFS